MDTQNTKPAFNHSLFKATLGTLRDKKVIWLRFDLGHNDIRTTQIYTKVSDISLAKVASPLDRI